MAVLGGVRVQISLGLLGELEGVLFSRHFADVCGLGLGLGLFDGYFERRLNVMKKEKAVLTRLEEVFLLLQSIEPIE